MGVKVKAASRLRSDLKVPYLTKDEIKKHPHYPELVKLDRKRRLFQHELDKIEDAMRKALEPFGTRNKVIVKEALMTEADASVEAEC